MTRDQYQDRLGDLNQNMFRLVSSFPQAASELVDFHFKSTIEQYLDAIAAVGGRKVLLVSRDSEEVKNTLRKVLLLSNLVVFNCGSYVRSPALSFFPIPDEFHSPVLGLTPVLDPDTRKYRPPKPVEVAYLVSALAQKAIESSTSIRLLGIEWNGSGRGWERSEFTRTSEPYRNDKGEECHIAAGLIHVQIPKNDTLLDELRLLLENGRVAFTPFIRTSGETTGVDESTLKASLIDAVLTVHGPTIQTDRGSVHPLTSLKIPYLEKVPLSLLSRILDDEQESISAFRLAIDRALEDIETAVDTRDAAAMLTQIKREIIEDELNKVRQVCDRVSRMNALARIGAYVATGALSVAAILGLDPPSVICGAAGVATATVAELYRNYEEKSEIRRSPMYFVFRLEKSVR